MANQVRAVDLGVPESSWRKLSPLSPLLSSWSIIVVAFSVLIINNWQSLANLIQVGVIGGRGIAVAFLGTLAIFVPLVLIVALYSWLAWRRTSYAVTSQAVWYRTGILFRSQRHARLERIQAVDLVFPLLGRIFGLGKISIEVAGASDSALSFGYLRDQQLHALRAEIMARAATLRQSEAALGTGSAGRDTGVPPGADQIQPGADQIQPGADQIEAPQSQPVFHEAPQRELYRVPPGRLAGSQLLSLSLIAGMIITVVSVVSLGAAAAWGALGLWGLVMVFPVTLTIFSVLWSRFSAEFNFRVSASLSGIRVERGLLETRSQTIPPRRVHSVRISQPLLWRVFGWYRVVMNQAGYHRSGESQSARTSHVLLPVGSRQEALMALWLVLPDLGVPEPNRFLDAALAGEGPSEGFTVNPVSSRIFDPLVYKRRGAATTGTCLVIRDGKLNRRTTFVPYARIQSLGATQGPAEKALALATVSAHTVPGPFRPRLPHLGDQEAARMTELLVREAKHHREVEPPDRWVSRVLDRAAPEATENMD